MNSNEDKLYIKIIALDAIYDFVLEIFWIKTVYGPKILLYVYRFWNLKFKIKFCDTKLLQTKKINYKVVDRIENYNFHIDYINIQDCLIILNFKFQNL